MAAELIYYILDTDTALRADKSEIANTNLPECIYKQQNKDIDLQFLNTNHEDGNGAFDDFFTGHAALTVTGSTAADNNWNHISTAILGETLTIAVPVSDFDINTVGSDFDPERPAGTINFVDGESVNYNDITDLGSGNYNLQTADINFDTADFTPIATHTSGEALRTIELPIIKDPLIDVTDKATGLYHVSFDCFNSIYQSLVEGSADIDDCIFEIQIFEAGVPILVKQFDIALKGVLDDDGGLAPAPATGYFSSAASDSRYVRQALTTAYGNSADALLTMKMFVRDGSASEYITLTQLFTLAAASSGLIVLDSVSFKTVQENTVYTVPAGKKFKPTTGDILTDTITGAATPPTYKWKADAADLMGATVATMNAVGQFESDGLDPTIYYPAGTLIKMEITVAGTSTTHTGKAIIKGILIDA